MRCIECKQPFKSTRANLKLCSNKCRQARHQRLCCKPRDFDPEHDRAADRAFPDTTDREMRRDVEARRLVAEYALLRPGMQPYEITATRLREIRSVIAASTRL